MDSSSYASTLIVDLWDEIFPKAILFYKTIAVRLSKIGRNQRQLGGLKLADITHSDQLEAGLDNFLFAQQLLSAKAGRIPDISGPIKTFSGYLLSMSLRP